MTLLAAVMLPVLANLGCWQLDRAAEKRGYEQAYFEQLSRAPVPAPDAEADLMAFLRVRLEGRYQRGKHYLVDNRTHQGRPGYWVVSRFSAADGRRWLVNRGWIPAPPRRDRLPEFSTPEGRVAIVGMLWPDTGLPPLVGASDWPEGWPKRVQRLDVQRMAREENDVVPVEVRLDRAQPGALEPAPQAVTFSPARHQGYAAQWFGLAAVLAAGYLVYGFTRTRGSHDN